MAKRKKLRIQTLAEYERGINDLFGSAAAAAKKALGICPHGACHYIAGHSGAHSG